MATAVTSERWKRRRWVREVIMGDPDMGPRWRGENPKFNDVREYVKTAPEDELLWIREWMEEQGYDSSFLPGSPTSESA